MYNLSTPFNTAAKSNNRKILTKASFNDTAELTGENIIDISVTEAVNASGGISMGATISSMLEMTVKTPDFTLPLDDGFVSPLVGFEGLYIGIDFTVDEDGALAETAAIDADGVLTYNQNSTVAPGGELVFYATNTLEYCPLGKFYISKTESNNNFKTTFKITAYDGFSKTEKKYLPSITMPNSAEAILADIASQCGISLSPDIEYPAGVFGLYDYTCRQYIGYFAGLVGKNARFDRDGNLTFVWYQNHDFNIYYSDQYMGSLKRLTDAPVNVRSISSGAADAIFSAGEGFGISFENPFMTQDILDAIWADIGSFSFVPLQVKWRGNPAIEAGDIVTVEDKDGARHTVYIMEQVLKISGGMYSEVKCYGQSEAEMNFSASPTQKKLQQVYTKLQEAIREATLMMGANGGVFEIVDGNNDGINDGWIIHSVDGQKFIKANINGIGITEDGGNTFRQALTALGLNADAITTGYMSAQRLKVGDEVLGNVFSVDTEDDGHISVTIGAAGSNIKQRQTNDAVTFVDQTENPVARFSPTGAEWDSLKQMKYCGFVWTKSGVSGNVRFTKAEDE